MSVIHTSDPHPNAYQSGRQHTYPAAFVRSSSLIFLRSTRRRIGTVIIHHGPRHAPTRRKIRYIHLRSRLLLGRGRSPVHVSSPGSGRRLGTTAVRWMLIVHGRSLMRRHWRWRSTVSRRWRPVRSLMLPRLSVTPRGPVTRWWGSGWRTGLFLIFLLGFLFFGAVPSSFSRNWRWRVAAIVTPSGSFRRWSTSGRHVMRRRRTAARARVHVTLRSMTSTPVATVLSSIWGHSTHVPRWHARRWVMRRVSGSGRIVMIHGRRPTSVPRWGSFFRRRLTGTPVIAWFWSFRVTFLGWGRSCRCHLSLWWTENPIKQCSQ